MCPSVRNLKKNIVNVLTPHSRDAYLGLQQPAGDVRHAVGAHWDHWPNPPQQHPEPERRPGREGGPDMFKACKHRKTGTSVHEDDQWPYMKMDNVSPLSSAVQKWSHISPIRVILLVLVSSFGELENCNCTVTIVEWTHGNGGGGTHLPSWPIAGQSQLPIMPF